uniref:Metalloendopeptidase n=1 Tax=Romanomermis culicivorax TaxID=13658 RepID=A0A915L3T4_ROMCU
MSRRFKTDFRMQSALLLPFPSAMLQLSGVECSSSTILTHELIHQCRNDRDGFIDVIWNNIDKRRYSNFLTYNFPFKSYTPYDHESIMHYYDWAFSIDAKHLKSMKSRKKRHPMLGNELLSKFDVIKLNRHYHCGETNSQCKDKLSAAQCNKYGMGIMRRNDNGDVDRSKQQMQAVQSLANVGVGATIPTRAQQKWPGSGPVDWLQHQSYRCLDSEWALRECPFTCGQCYKFLPHVGSTIKIKRSVRPMNKREACVDSLNDILPEHCIIWARRGLCHMSDHITFMRLNCPKSCAVNC